LALISVSHAQLREPPLPGTYYSAKDFEWSPPWPFNPHPELEAAEIAPGIFVFDDTAVPDTPEQLAARAAHQAAVEHAKTIAANPALAEAERAARQAGQEAAWAKNRQRFLPTLHQPLIYRDGSPATMPGLVGGHRLLVAETLPQKQAEAAAKRQRAEQWAKQTGNPEIVPLEDGRAAYLEMVEDGLPVYKGSFNLNAARTISTDRVRPGGSTGLNLTGTNTFFGMWDEGAVRTTHTEFSGRVTPMDSVTNVNFHVSNQVVEVTVSNVTRTVDGDAEGFDTISPQASAKNILTVGAVFPISGGYTGVSQVVLAPFSSCGPTDDGRIKPDVVADGISLITTDDDADNDVQFQSGTSFSAPGVTGSLNLLRQLFEQLYPDAPALRASTWKALLIHTADEAGPNPGPDYRFGWGLMNTRRAAELLGQNATNGWKAFVKQALLQPGDSIEFTVTAAGGTNALRISHAWTDAPGVADSIFLLDSITNKLVNDLDIRIISPSGVTNFPYVLDPAARTNAATRADNTRDNVEQVVITNAVETNYLVRITHKASLTNGQPQWDSIVLDGIVPQAKPPLVITDFAITGTNTLALSWEAVVGQNYQVQYRSNIEGPGWTSIGGVVNASKAIVSVELPYDSQQPQRFFQVSEVP